MLESKNENALCSVNSPGYLYVGTEIKDNFWSRDQYQAAGVIGFNLNEGSVKEMLDYQFDGLTLQLTNFTDLSFA